MARRFIQSETLGDAPTATTFDLASRCSQPDDRSCRGPSYFATQGGGHGVALRAPDVAPSPGPAGFRGCDYRPDSGGTMK